TTGDTAAPASATTTAQGYASDHFVPPIELRDPPPGTLDVVVAVQMDGTTPGTPVMEDIGLIFIAQDQNVQFIGSERVTCNGKDLPIHTQGASLMLVHGPAEQASGTTIACEYVAGGASARFSLRVPQAPAITSPTAGASVPRSRQTLVTYQSDPAAGPVMGVVALAPGSALPKTFATINRPGPGQVTLDTSGFAAVAGSLHLSVDLEPSVTTAGTPFHTIKASGIANIAEDVTWT
ncbi:MAG TPA: hypothetical protein VGR57_00635, partial [Ktedonobacterales bacterium]|nr:hypothetical protein [Ktedonobacterales bacterium]